MLYYFFWVDGVGWVPCTRKETAGKSPTVEVEADPALIRDDRVLDLVSDVIKASRK